MGKAGNIRSGKNNNNNTKNKIYVNSVLISTMLKICREKKKRLGRKYPQLATVIASDSE